MSALPPTPSSSRSTTPINPSSSLLKIPPSGSASDLLYTPRESSPPSSILSHSGSASPSPSFVVSGEGSLEPVWQYQTLPPMEDFAVPLGSLSPVSHISGILDSAILLPLSPPSRPSSRSSTRSFRRQFQSSPPTVSVTFPFSPSNDPRSPTSQSPGPNEGFMAPLGLSPVLCGSQLSDSLDSFSPDSFWPDSFSLSSSVPTSSQLVPGSSPPAFLGSERQGSQGSQGSQDSQDSQDPFPFSFSFSVAPSNDLPSLTSQTAALPAVVAPGLEMVIDNIKLPDFGTWPSSTSFASPQLGTVLGTSFGGGTEYNDNNKDEDKDEGKSDDSLLRNTGDGESGIPNIGDGGLLLGRILQTPALPVVVVRDLSMVSGISEEVVDLPTPASQTHRVIDPNYRPFEQKFSAAGKEWQRRKDEDGAKNTAIDELMELVGLEQVKEQVLAISAKVDICKRQGIGLENERFHVVFQGNPGTGKTTVARIYAEFLESSGILSSSTLTETSGAKLAYGGPQAAHSMIKGIVEDGGVLFVDEAYQLTAPHATYEGRQVLDIILTEMENHIGELVVIFVGYNDEMQSFFEHNPGLASRIPYTLQFADFEDVQLWDILRDSIEKRWGGKMVIEDGMGGLFMRIAIRRLAAGRGIRNFGNARSVHNLLARITARQAERLTEQRKTTHKDPKDKECFFFTKEDLIGPDPSKVILNSPAWNKLKSLIGLAEVKASANAMVDMIITNYQRELDEQKPLKFSLNRVFFGSPGTGKTTVAKLYGQILADIGLLSKGEVMVKNPSDFIGQCLGKSEAKTRAILAVSLGKVLIIDEAYMLNTGGGGGQQDAYRTAVIDTLVAEVQSVPGDDRCILFLGYEDKLKSMFHNVNPGLARRFAIEDPFRFQDFTVPELDKILELKMKEEDVTAEPDALAVALRVLGRAQMRPNFSNGGEVDNCLAKAKLNYQIRQSKKPPAKREHKCCFQSEDFDPDFERNNSKTANCRKHLEGQVDEAIIKELERYQQVAIDAQEDGLDPSKEIPTKIVFKGPPGTGKTIVARNMGKVYYDMGFLSTSDVVECSASDFIGQFVGQTGPKTKAKLDEALGKVLFVDEAYRLAKGQYATEAVNELIYLLSTPRYDGKIVVILAGYTQDMNKLMAARPALSGLFPDEIIFHNISAADCLTLLDRELVLKRTSAPFLKDTSNHGYIQLLRMMRALSLIPSWSNARDIKTLAKNMSSTAIRGKSVTGGPQRNLSAKQAFECTKKMLAMQLERYNKQEGYGVKSPLTSPESARVVNQEFEDDTSATVMEDDSSATVMEETHACETSSNAQHQSTLHLAKGAPCVIRKIAPPQSPSQLPRDRKLGDACIREEGVSDVVWEQLQADKEIQESKLAKGDQIARRKNNAVQEKIRKMGLCEMGYEWIEQAGGYVCAGGSHTISHEQLDL